MDIHKKIELNQNIDILKVKLFEKLLTVSNCTHSTTTMSPSDPPSENILFTDRAWWRPPRLTAAVKVVFNSAEVHDTVLRVDVFLDKKLKDNATACKEILNIIVRQLGNVPIHIEN